MLAVLSDEAVAELCRASSSVHLAGGEVLFCKGDRSEGGYIVVSGCIALRTGDERGSILYVYPGSLVGELSLITSIERSAEAVAQERTELRRIRRADLARILRKDPLSAARLRTYLERRAGEFSRVMTMFRSSDRTG